MNDSNLFDKSEIGEDLQYLTEQIITYIGNKRTLLPLIGDSVKEVCGQLHQRQLDILDVFSGSGIVSRYLKQYSKILYSNDLEGYCKTINSCYLKNRSEIDMTRLRSVYEKIKKETIEQLKSGFITEMYAPNDDSNIQLGERVFYTHRNAMYIDTCRQLISKVQSEFRDLLLAPLLYEASVHTNTSGVFKGFYKNSTTGIGQFGGNGKNALTRIMSDIEIPFPVFSAYECETHVLQQDANLLYCQVPEVDLAYLDPPYNQHPYGSNYFMLNVINDYKKPERVSEVSGIPTDWNKSLYNQKKLAKQTFSDLCNNLKAKFLLISFNSEGFISKDEMMEVLSEIGKVSVVSTPYNTFRGSRNLNQRDIHVTEFLYLVKKR